MASVASVATVVSAAPEPSRDPTVAPPPAETRTFCGIHQDASKGQCCIGLDAEDRTPGGMASFHTPFPSLKLARWVKDWLAGERGRQRTKMSEKRNRGGRAKMAVDETAVMVVKSPLASASGSESAVLPWR